MKRIMMLILMAVSVALSYAQDIITFKDGSLVKGTVTKVTTTMVEYQDDQGARHIASKSQVFSINYEGGRVETFDVPGQYQTVGVFSPETDDPDLTRRLRRLKIWRKITRVYGVVNLVGGLILINAEEDEDKEDDWSSSSSLSNHTLGIIGIAEGSTALVVSICLQVRRNKLLRENNLVGSMPILQKDFKINDNLTLSPSVNLMSYRNNPVEGVGAGLSIKF